VLKYSPILRRAVSTRSSPRTKIGPVQFEGIVDSKLQLNIYSIVEYTIIPPFLASSK
jgi:hypothetical protein